MKTTLNSTAKRYNRIFLFLAAAVLLVISVTNVVIDPKNQIGLVQIDNVNTIKYLATGGRFEKSARLANGDFNALIAGSSRTQVGIDPGHPALGSYRAYNAALSGTDMKEVTGVLDYALRHQKIERLILGLDFTLFTRNKNTSPDYGDSLFADSYSWVMPYLLSTSTFKRSLKTVRLNRKGSTRIHSASDGFLDKTGSDIDHRLRFQEVLSKNFLIDPEYYGAYDYDYENILRLGKSLDQYMSNKTIVDLFISPVHARQLEAIRAMGLWDQYLQWKRDLILLTQRLRDKHSTAISLWDFSGYNSITTESVPALNSDIKMQWYWESSHYKKSTGNMIIGRIMGAKDPDIPADFGIVLNQQNFQSQTNMTEFSRAHYMLTHPNEIIDVEEIVDRTKIIRTQRALQAGVKALKSE